MPRPPAHPILSVTTLPAIMYAEYIHTSKPLPPLISPQYDNINKMLDSQLTSTRTLSSLSSSNVDGFSNFLAIAIEKAIRQNLLAAEDIKSYDPVAIVALPRLALLVAMIDHDWRNMVWQYDARWIVTKREEEDAFTSGKHWFRHRETQVQQLAIQCQSILSEDLIALEQSLVDGQGGEIFKHICSLSGNLMSSRNFCRLLQSSIDDWKAKLTEEEVDSLLI